MLDTAVCPETIKVGVPGYDPGVVIVREQMHFGLGRARLQVPEHGCGEQQVTDLVPLDYEYFHRRIAGASTRGSGRAAPPAATLTAAVEGVADTTLHRAKGILKLP